MNARFPTFLPLLLLVVLAAPVGAGVLHVPADYPTIQAAIDAAHDGDDVLVAPGTYVELVDFEGKAITVTSELGPDVTTIDGNGLGSTVSFKRGEDRVSLLRGFTIRNGTGTLIQVDGWDQMAGGGVICLASSPTIEGNHIIDSSYLDLGAGLYCGEGASPLVTGNYISNNKASRGGGLACFDSSLTIERNVFYWNYAGGGGGAIFAGRSSIIVRDNQIDTNGATQAGGMRAQSSQVLIAHNQITHNGTDEEGRGGLELTLCQGSVSGNVFRDNGSVSGMGGEALHAEQCALSITQNLFEENGWNYFSGIVTVAGPPGQFILIEDNAFRRNRTGGYGAVIECYADARVHRNTIEEGGVGVRLGRGRQPATIEQNVIRGTMIGISLENSDAAALVVGNTISGCWETGIWLEGTPGLSVAKGRIASNLITGCQDKGIACTVAEPVIEGNTITGNSAPDAGGGIFVGPSSTATVASNIVWHNQAPVGAQIHVDGSSTASVTYCDVEGGWPGTGNIDADPLFADPGQQDWRLLPGSPCVDAGDPADHSGGRDVYAAPRFLDGDLDGRRVMDIGAAEYDNVRLAIWLSGREPGHPWEVGRMLGIDRDATLVVDTSGKAGLNVFLFVGLVPGEVELGRYGPLFLDLTGPWIMLPWGLIPSRVTIALPADMPSVPIIVQELAVDALHQVGNTSNPAELSIR